MNTTLGMANWFWWQHRIFLCVAFFSVIIAQVAFWSVGAINEANVGTIALLQLCSMLSAVFAGLTLFTFGTNLDLTSGRSSFPTWLYNLPVSPVKPVVFAVIGLIALVGWGWLPFSYSTFVEELRNTPKLLDRSTLSEYYLFRMVMPWLSISAFGCWLQAIAWTPYRTAWYRGVAIGILFCTLIGLIISSNFFGEWYPLTAILVSLATGIAAAIYSGIRGRELAWLAESEGTPGILEGFGRFAKPDAKDGGEIETDYRFGESKKLKFRSPSSALAWRDWKQLSRVPITLLMPIAALMLLTIALVQFTPRVIMIMVIPAMLMFVNGPTLGKPSSFKQKSALSAYLAALPVSDGSLLRSRIKNAVYVALTLWLIAVAVYAISLLRIENRIHATKLATSTAMTIGCTGENISTVKWFIVAAMGLASLLTAFVAPLPGMLLGLFGRKNAERTFWIGAGTTMVVVSIWLSSYASKTWTRLDTPEKRIEYAQQLSDAFPGFLVGLVLVKLLLAAIGIYFLQRRGVIDWKGTFGQLVKMAAAYALVAGTFIVLLLPTSFNPGYVAAVVLILFPVASLFHAQVAIDCNRHR